ncbi:MAG TPA: PAS domain S-box protein [Dehalococcoidia bacterium]|nr:PAS domain S-box protein [Dehalococcoidia bacterium]
MRDRDKTKQQLIDELKEMRQQITQSDEALKRAERILLIDGEIRDAVLNNTPDFIAVVDEEYIVSGISKSMANRFGKEPGELIGTHGFDLLSPVLADSRKQYLDEVFRTGKSLRWEDENKGAYFDNIAYPLSTEEGQVTRIILIARDITERKKAEEALRVSERNYRQLIESLQEGIWVIDKDANTTYVNQPMADMLGYSPDEMLGKHLFDFIDESGVEIANQLLNRRRHGIKEQHDFEFVRKDGTRLYTLINTSPLTDDTGSYIGAIAGILDISERRQAEEALKESEQKYRALFESELDGVVVLNEVMKVLLANKAAADMFGFDSVEELLKINLFDYVAPEEREQILELRTKALSADYAPSPGEYRCLKKSGEEIWVSAILKVIEYQGEMAGLASFRDVTEHKKIEEALRESEEKFRSLTEKSVVGTYVIQDLKMAYVNPSLARTLGYEPEEIIGNMTPADFIHPDDIGIAMERLGERFEGKVEDRNTTYRVIKKDGSIIHIEVYTMLIDYQGRPAVMGTMIDITDRMQAEQEHRLIIQTALDGFWLNNLEGELLEVNDSYCEMIGYTREELLQMRIADVEAIETPKMVAGHTDKIVEQGSDRFESKHRRKDGTIIDVEISVNYLDVGEGRLFVFVRDITERKRMEEERRRIERLESLGTLAGGIAHDFNNLLTGIMGNISLVRGYLEPDSKAAERLLEAERASLRARDLTQQLLTFARGGEPIKEATAVGRLISDSANFALMGSKSSCVIDIPVNLWQAEIDRGQMNEVIHNLVINADEAMPEGGVINISARNRVLGDGNTLSLPKGDYVEVTVEDYGVGIPEENLPRIFEPYFTTKEKGSGLGLTTTYSIIRNRKGHITVDSVPGEHTTFSIYLPAIRKALILPEEEAEDIQAHVTGKILIMDDEEAIRRLLQRALSEVGHDITTAVDGADAIEQYVKAKEKKQPYNLVILDLTVPGGMGGMEAMEKLLEIDPKVKAIVSSGYSTDSIMADYRKYGFTAVIAKPYRVRELRRIIRDILQERNG